MSFTSYTYFLVFLSLAVFVYYLFPKRFRWCVLLAASYVFYFLSSNWLITFLVVSTVTIYGIALWIQKIQLKFAKAKEGMSKEDKKAAKQKTARHKKVVIGLGLIVNIGLLLFLKYYNFFGGNVNSILEYFNINAELPLLHLMLPLGISFYTLQAVGYIIDVYRGKYEADRNLGRVALFLCFFPQIVEGPIGRYDQLAHQVYEGQSFKYVQFKYGCQLILWGLFKKLVIADRTNPLVQSIFDNYTQYNSSIYIIIATLAYTLQLYADFSGCIDIVRGSAQLFGIELAQNFERPFFAKSINEFWRRWHITLGAWLRDYVFYSVSLSKPVKSITKRLLKYKNAFWAQTIPSIIALFFVWLCNGFWHGSSWKYVFYGMYYFGLIVLGMLCEPFVRRLLEKCHLSRDSRGYQSWRTARTFILVCIGMLIFRAESLLTAFRMFFSVFQNFSFSVMFDNSLLKLGIDSKDYIILLIGTITIFCVSLLQEKGIHIRETISKFPLVIRWGIYLAAIFSVILFGAYGFGYIPVEMIYAQF